MFSTSSSERQHWLYLPDTRMQLWLRSRAPQRRQIAGFGEYETVASVFQCKTWNLVNRRLYSQQAVQTLSTSSASISCNCPVLWRSYHCVFLIGKANVVVAMVYLQPVLRSNRCMLQTCIVEKCIMKSYYSVASFSSTILAFNSALNNSCNAKFIGWCTITCEVIYYCMCAEVD